MIIYVIIIRSKKYNHESYRDVYLSKVPQFTAKSESHKSADSAGQTIVSSN